jgi:peptide/nickel transport system substrate-binding protein
VSDDGLTYTFQLRKGVRFSDGTPFNAEAAKASLERRAEVGAGPSYMVEPIKSIKTPSASELVINLEHPVAPFLDYLASPYGPVMVSPTAVERHAQGDDLAAKWLASNSAGTGPYKYGRFQKSVQYTLGENKRYWGDPPGYRTIEFKVIPDFAQQRVQLEGGEIDLITHGLSKEDLAAIEDNPDLEVVTLPALFKAQVWVNPKSAVFGDPAARDALQAALDKQALTEDSLGPRGEVSAEALPAGMLPEGAAPDNEPVGDQSLGDALGASRGESVIIGWYSDPAMKRLADLLQVQLQEAGLEATTREYKPATLFSLPTTPDQRPDLFTAAFNPDATHPDTWSQVYYVTDAPVNLLGCSVPAADKLTARAAAQPTREQSIDLSSQAAAAYAESDCWLNVADVKDAYAARAGIGGFEKELPWVFTPRMASLTPPE